MTESFWVLPDTAKLRTPVTILKEQATELGNATNGVLSAEVISYSKAYGNATLPDSFPGGTRLDIKIPILKDYRVSLLDYRHDITMYPGILHVSFGGGSTGISNEEEFIVALKNALSSDSTKNVLGNLLSQALAA
jgi:hypothetical protein